MQHIISLPICERTVSTAQFFGDDASSTSESDTEKEDEDEDEEWSGSEKEDEESEEEEDDEEEEGDEEGEENDDNSDDIPRPQKTGDAISVSHRVQLRALVSELIRTKANHPVTIFATGNGRVYSSLFFF